MSVMLTFFTALFLRLESRSRLTSNIAWTKWRKSLGIIAIHRRTLLSGQDENYGNLP